MFYTKIKQNKPLLPVSVILLIPPRLKPIIMPKVHKSKKDRARTKKASRNGD